jgi:septal ring factor EnvC (AmiA/AmiB activator)
MAAYEGPDLLEEDFPTTEKGTAVAADDREELDNQVSSLEREKATVEESRRRFAEFQTGREEMMHELTRSLGLLEEAQLEASREAEQMARTMEDLRDALTKVDALEEVDTHDDQWKVHLTRNLTTIENARMELNAARHKWLILSATGENERESFAAPQPTTNGLPMPASFSQLCLWGLALTWPVLLIGSVIVTVLILKS